MCILKTFMVICLSFLPVNYSKVYESNCNQNDFVGCKVTRAGASLVTALQSYGILLWETAGLWFMNEDSLKKHQYHPAWTITLMGSHLNSNPMWGRLLAFWNSVVSFLDEGATCVINSCKQVEWNELKMQLPKPGLLFRAKSLTLGFIYPNIGNLKEKFLT